MSSELEPLFDKLARAASRRGPPVHPGMDLASTQHAIGETALWHARVLAGWVPPAEIEPMLGGERRLDFVPAAHARLTVGWRTVLGVRRPADPRLELPPERGLVPAYAGSQAPTVQRWRGGLSTRSRQCRADNGVVSITTAHAGASVGVDVGRGWRAMGSISERSAPTAVCAADAVDRVAGELKVVHRLGMPFSSRVGITADRR